VLLAGVTVLLAGVTVLLAGATDETNGPSEGGEGAEVGETVVTAGVTDESNGPSEGGEGAEVGETVVSIGVTIVSEGVVPNENPIVETVTIKIMTPKLIFFKAKCSPNKSAYSTYLICRNFSKVDVSTTIYCNSQGITTSRWHYPLCNNIG